MIEPDRPLCIMDYVPPTDTLARLRDPFKDYGQWTLSEMPYSEIQFEWESCQAGFSKEVDGALYFLKCMEPAVYYISLNHRGLIGYRCGSYCEYHKPRVQLL